MRSCISCTNQDSVDNVADNRVVYLGSTIYGVIALNV